MSVDEIEDLEQEIASLEETLHQKKSQLRQLQNKGNGGPCPYAEFLSSEEVVRYSRQMIMPQITNLGQVALKRSKVLVVGAGGLGCPASLYLAAAGVGEIHVVDYDEVELSNLHRQILHFEGDVGRPKVQSACEKLNKLNKDIKVVPLHLHASSALISHIKTVNFDVVLDCSDNAPTRYLLNDLCVFEDVPLISGSALQMEGQLTVYHYKTGPCYRCLFPIPPPAYTVTNCGDGGVLGPVAGVIGVLQALEAIKILTGIDGVLSGRMLLFDGVDSVFRNVKLRKKVPTCEICGDDPKITAPVDYEHFCGSRAHDKVVNIDILKGGDNVEVEKLPQILEGSNVVVDVRPELEYEMCRLPKTVNLPYSAVLTEKGMTKLREILENSESDSGFVYMLCRRGNDSQRSVEYFRENFPDKSVTFVNVKGGLHAYSRKIDSSFPVY